MNLFELFAKLSLDSSSFTAGLDSAMGQGKSFASSLGSMLGAADKTITNVGTKAVKAVGTAATATGAVVGKFVKDAISVGSDFDVSVSQIAATMGKTVNEIGDLRDKALEMGSATNYTATQAAEGLNILAMSGYNATESIGMIEDVLHLAAAGSMELSASAGYISGTMKGFNDATKTSGYYADLMAKGATLANTSVAQLGEAMSSGAAGAAAYSQSADSMTLALLRLAEQGEVGTAAGTALSAAMKNIYTPTNQAAGALKTLGVSAYDAQGNARDFNTVVNELEASFAGMSEQEKNAYKQTIFGIQGLNAYNKMVVTSTEKQKAWAQELANASDGAGAAADQYNTMTDNLKGDIDILNSALDGFRIGVSDTLTSTLRKYVQFGTSAIEQLTSAFKTGGLEGLIDVGSDIISQIIVGITNKLPDLINAFGKVITKIGENLTKNKDVIRKALEEVLKAAFTVIPQAIQSFLPLVKEIVPTIAKAILQYQAMIREVGIELITVLLQGFAEDADGIAQTAIDLIMSLINTIKENAPLMIDAAYTIITSLISALVENLPELIPAAVDMILTIVDALLNPDSLKLILDGALQLILALAEGMIAAIPQLLERLPEIIMNIVQFLLDAIPMIIEAGTQLLKMLLSPENIGTIIQFITKQLPKIIFDIINAILEHIPEIVQAGIDLLVALVENLPYIITEVLKGVGELMKSIWEGIKSWFGKMKEVGGDLVKNIWAGIKSWWEKVKQGFKNLVSGLVDGVKSFLGIKSPSKTFAMIGKNIADGLGVGFEKEFSDVSKELIEDVGDTVNEFDDVFNPYDVSKMYSKKLNPEYDYDPDNYVQETKFSDSALGKASTGIVSGLMETASAGINGGSGNQIVIQLVLPDKTTIAEVLFDPLRKVAEQRGVMLGA